MSEEELKRMEDFVNATLKTDEKNEYRLGYEDALRRCYYLVDNLQKENKQLKERIDKAIEVVRLCNTKCSKEVIEILKGDDNE